ncbi:tyrosine-type recombinase/integrase [Brevundimonas variabilis]|uniref:Integrase n=1 Tax=Brevundimonas variabilis TaxID=74312 RepID=A0A7W9CG13_9CAUL|nr:site-specific integrase [Brevundimonas variabilis]MBB5744811.1 integrase [Brevundimonas variabilis]
MHHRKRIHLVLGLTSEGWTIKKCEACIEALKADILFGTSALPVGRKTQVRFGELADWYLLEMEATNGKNLTSKRPQINRRLKPYLTDQCVEALTEEHVGRYSRSRLDEGASPATVNRELATLSHIISTAVRRKRIPKVPCRIPKLDEPQGRIVTLQGDQIVALRRAAIQDPHPDLWLFVEFGLNTAMRHSEITSARFDQIDWTTQRLFIPDAKAGMRHQPLTNDLLAVLKRVRGERDDPEGWIFPARHSRSKSMHTVKISKAFQRAVIAAGLNPKVITPHVMRHTAITRLIEQGVPLATVQQISGHKTIQMVLRYTHVSNAHVDEAMRALERTLRQNAA